MELSNYLYPCFAILAMYYQSSDALFEQESYLNAILLLKNQDVYYVLEIYGILLNSIHQTPLYKPY